MTERCTASGFPVPNITWLQNGKQMPLCLKDESNNCIGQNYQELKFNSDEHALSLKALSYSARNLSKGPRKIHMLGK